MNIFVLDKNPQLAAQYHCDKHVVKMVLETAQILSTVLIELLPEYKEGLYRPTHKTHPCTLWAAESENNFWWLLHLGHYLSEEFTYRYGGTHKSTEIIKTAANIFTYTWSLGFPKTDITPFVQAMPDYCKDPDDPVNAYRTYYIMEKKHLLQYTKREKPSWLE